MLGLFGLFPVQAAPAAPPGLAPSGPAPSAAARSSSEAPVKLEAENQLEWPLGCEGEVVSSEA